MRDVVAGGDIGVVQKPLTVFQRLANQGWLRKALILILMALGWELYARRLNNPLLVPTFSATLEAFWDGIASGDIPQKVLELRAAAAQGLRRRARAGHDADGARHHDADRHRSAGDADLDLQPAAGHRAAAAGAPLVRPGRRPIMFVLVHSVLWAVALNTHSGFRSVSNTLRMVGRNYGLRGIPFIVKILIPAAFPSILTGLKIGWAFAWRTLIAAELVFGV